MGSLVIAVASLLDARSQHGVWLLRIDDLDEPRVSKEAEHEIIRTLSQHDLHWDEPIVHQQDHISKYKMYIEKLMDLPIVFCCTCRRREIDRQFGCVKACRERRTPPSEPYSLRINLGAGVDAFHDRIQGQVHSDNHEVQTNFSILRRDGYPTYPLSVVVDDFLSNVTHVVRGMDLLSNTFHQIHLMQLLGFEVPVHAHLPVVNERGEIKLSKRNKSTAIDNRFPRQNLVWSLQLLGMDPPNYRSCKDLLEWGIEHWESISVVPEESITTFVSI